MGAPVAAIKATSSARLGGVFRYSTTVRLDAGVADQRQHIARGAAFRVVIDRDGAHEGDLSAVRPCSYQSLELLTIFTTSSITGTSISTPTTVASAAPDC
jgi:hypothetical protein